MPESILTRIGRIISGTTHSIVEKLENQTPEVLLQEAISEIDSTISQSKVELGRLEIQKRDLKLSVSSLENELNNLDSQIKVAFEMKREELVKIGLGRQVDIENQIIPLKNQLASIVTTERDYSQAITGLIAKRNQMEDDLHYYNQIKNEDLSAKEIEPESLLPQILKADEAESKFNRVLSKANMKSNRVLSKDAKTEKLIELANLERTAQIEKKFKKLKDE